MRVVSRADLVAVQGRHGVLLVQLKPKASVEGICKGRGEFDPWASLCYAHHWPPFTTATKARPALLAGHAAVDRVNAARTVTAFVTRQEQHQIGHVLWSAVALQGDALRNDGLRRFRIRRDQARF